MASIKLRKEAILSEVNRLKTEATFSSLTTKVLTSKLKSCRARVKLKCGTGV